MKLYSLQQPNIKICDEFKLEKIAWGDEVGFLDNPVTDQPVKDYRFDVPSRTYKRVKDGGLNLRVDTSICTREARDGYWEIKDGKMKSGQRLKPSG